MKHLILLAVALLLGCGGAMAQEPASDEIVITEAHYATYYNSQKAYKMPEGCKGIIYYIEEDIDEFQEVSYNWISNDAYAAGSDVPAGQALVIYSPDVGTKTLDFIDHCSTSYNAQTNLCGTDAAQQITEMSPLSTDAYYYYALSYDSDEARNLGFYWRTEGGAPFTNGAHRAYLRAEKSVVDKMLASPQHASKARGFSLETAIATDIESRFASDTDTGKATNEVHDLTGRRLHQLPTSGVYIMNGKKYQVK